MIDDEISKLMDDYIKNEGNQSEFVVAHINANRIADELQRLSSMFENAFYFSSRLTDFASNLCKMEGQFDKEVKCINLNALRQRLLKKYFVAKQ